MHLRFYRLTTSTLIRFTQQRWCEKKNSNGCQNIDHAKKSKKTLFLWFSAKSGEIADFFLHWETFVISKLGPEQDHYLLESKVVWRTTFNEFSPWLNQVNAGNSLSRQEKNIKLFIILISCLILVLLIMNMDCFEKNCNLFWSSECYFECCLFLEVP